MGHSRAPDFTGRFELPNSISTWFIHLFNLPLATNSDSSYNVSMKQYLSKLNPCGVHYPNGKRTEFLSALRSKSKVTIKIPVPHGTNLTPPNGAPPSQTYSNPINYRGLTYANRKEYLLYKFNEILQPLDIENHDAVRNINNFLHGGHHPGTTRSMTGSSPNPIYNLGDIQYRSDFFEQSSTPRDRRTIISHSDIVEESQLDYRLSSIKVKPSARTENDDKVANQSLTANDIFKCLGIYNMINNFINVTALPIRYRSEQTDPSPPITNSPYNVNSPNRAIRQHPQQAAHDCRRLNFKS